MTTASTSASGGRGAAGRTSFDLSRPWRVNPSVAIRPEPFGALLYHFGTRKLSFLKNLVVVDLVQSLAEHRDAESALAAAGITDDQRPLYLQALTALAESGMITVRDEK
ncbi:mycofactocin biosynthesis chaperone MftB [Gordonia sp. (in: high G+C Gram-positive bacteria)]|uniref:mycofactocin biosynthesis chaperone MftB n=1 Tax=Gordonia sp. (in: high G+C Gram-positive bacteria) TaxID=84139 RepID=UPI00262C8717|nr:mycofactocin biosynthesis chaperone MftB [Gordonia sp. (in: high G+C Gram-positive bacteria)]